ncbi:MAG: methylmalonyl-CoA mutase family protein, partial [Bacteroidota bacterium]|nr:methylmalonyl-CoA mutase family protein [Bacteroidota bacterium]
MNKLFTAFDPVSKNKWLKKINIDLKGNTEKLISTIEEIIIDPIYHADDNFKTYNSNFPSTWESYQLIDATNAATANERALLAIKNDISGLCFSNPNNLGVLLKDIKIEHIRIDFTKYKPSFPEIWKEYTLGKEIQGAFHGTEKVRITNFLDTIFAKGKTAKDQILSAYNQAKNEKNCSQFYFNIGSNFFIEIAKLKAFRILWESKKGVTPFIFANTTLQNKEEG